MQTFAAPAIAPARLRIHSGVDIAWAIALASAVLLAATVIGPDASWDLRNYHLYNGFAVLHGRIGVDLAPAQMQTFNAPLLDIVYTLLLGAFNDAPRLLAVMLAVPQALAVVSCWCWRVGCCRAARHWPQSLSVQRVWRHCRHWQPP